MPRVKFWVQLRHSGGVARNMTVHKTKSQRGLGIADFYGEELQVRAK